MKIYIEAGANDGVFQSCTLTLEQTKEWKGILIEPNKDAFQSCINNRSNETNYFFNCALVSFEYPNKEITFYNHAGHSAMGGTFKRQDTLYSTETTVQCRTLQSILDELNIQVVDKLFLDVEGFELEVLKGIDFSKTKIIELEIEVHSNSVSNFRNNSKEKNNIIEYMKKVNYYCSRVIDPEDANIKLILQPIVN